MSPTLPKSLPWDIVEKAILEEQEWLKSTLLKPFHKESEDFYKSKFCENCIFRRMATLIVSGNVRVKDIKSQKSLWGRKILENIKPHGKEWHRKMMSLVATHFKSLGYKIATEPFLNKGRADLGIYKTGWENFFVEVGSVSLPKLLFNLESMKNSTFLIVLSEKHAVEFFVKEADYKYRII